jgi:hypothetical protein
VPPFLFPAPASTLVLSARLLDRLDEDETDAILAHELAHVRRGDPWIRPVELLATALYWWFPLLPFARARLRAAEEASCDRDVIRALPGHARAYAEGLLKTVEPASHARVTPALATGAADSRELKERIMSIFQSASGPALPRRRRVLAMLPLLAAVSLTPAWVRDAPAPPAPPSAPGVLPAILAPPAIPSGGWPLELRRVSDGSHPGTARQELETRRTRLQLQRELLSVGLRENEMRLEFERMGRERELAALQAELEMTARAGRTEEAEELRRRLDRARERVEREVAIRKQAAGHERERQELELALMELELGLSEASLAGDGEAIEKTQNEMEALHGRLQNLDLESMRLDVERAKAELEAQEERYERMVREMEAEASAREGKESAE